jgi:prepilin-type N-terminal cleavage/methylation domain-containing protein
MSHRATLKLGREWQQRLSELLKKQPLPIPLVVVPPVPVQIRNQLRPRKRVRRRRGGFTLIELLIVIAIIALVSAVALPVVLPALSHRQVSESGRIVQAALAGARDRALQTGQPSGYRLIPDPAWPVLYTAAGQIDGTQVLAYNRFIPIEPAPEYTTGRLTVLASTPSGLTTNPVLTVEEAVFGSSVNEPTSWFWNIRVGDKLQINGSGIWYTVVGPVVASNPEGFVNVGPSGTTSPLTDTQNGVPVNPEFLFLVNGIDDNSDGWIDSGYDGVDNNADGIVDNNGPIDPTGQTKGEWETEVWPQGVLANRPISAQYTICRRPTPASNSRELTLPSNVVIDATTWSTSAPQRSRLPVDPVTGSVEILVYPNGSVVPTTRYSTPSSVGMAGAFLHLWLAERADVAAPSPLAQPQGSYCLVTVTARTGRISSQENPPASNPFAAAQQGAR